MFKVLTRIIVDRIIRIKINEKENQRKKSKLRNREI